MDILSVTPPASKLAIRRCVYMRMREVCERVRVRVRVRVRAHRWL